MANGMPDPGMPCGLHGSRPTPSCRNSPERRGGNDGGQDAWEGAAIDHGSVFNGILECEGHDSSKRKEGG